jgi:hypothetical protein
VYEKYATLIKKKYPIKKIPNPIPYSLAWSLAQQQFLYFLPLPQWQGSFLDKFLFLETTGALTPEGAPTGPAFTTWVR